MIERPAAGQHSLAEVTTAAWEQQWSQVPLQWRTLRYVIDAEPASHVFDNNPRYRGGHDFTPVGVPTRMCQELAWWVWVNANEAIRNIDPHLLKWFSFALTATVADYRSAERVLPESIADLDPDVMTRHAVLGFERRNHRLPSNRSRGKIRFFVRHLHLYVSARCTDRPWWSLDLWDVRADARIPVRQHEPAGDKLVDLGAIEVPWLREGVRFYLRTSLTSEMLRWSSVTNYARTMARPFGSFITERGVDDPTITPDRGQLRVFFTDFSEYLHSAAARNHPERPLSNDVIRTVESRVQSFYSFMLDHSDEAATATGDVRWSNLSDRHARLWGPAFRTKRSTAPRELSWYSATDLQRMLSYLDVLTADKGQAVTITHPDGTISVPSGLGDPQAARIWLLQALTGRRISEILMLDHQPLEAIPGQERPADAAAADGFVAKLRYQQTKVDGITATILVEQAVVDIIAAQQRWIADRWPDLAPAYLFLNLRSHYQGQRPRTLASYNTALRRLDRIHGLTDSQGTPLRFTQTHRLRHTRATELLNDGVPIHVVQRYLGHRSPEMTMRYAATLAATAEAEFLRHKKIGANGTDIGVSPADMYDMTQLSQRTDRVLPNGVCLLPPLKTCDKGNACLTCGHFATDLTHRDELHDQRQRTQALLDTRRRQFHTRTGRHLTDDNIWVQERLREIASLDAILERLDTAQTPDGTSICGGGTTDRQPLLQIQTRGIHHMTLDKAEEGNEQQ